MANSTLISIQPDERISSQIEALMRTRYPDWRLVSLSGDDAVQLIEAAGALRYAMYGRSTADGVEEYERFVALALRLLDPPRSGSRCVVLAPEAVPLDVVNDGLGHRGEQAIFAHMPLDQPLSEDLLMRILTPIARPLQTYLLVCPMAVDFMDLPRHQQDIVRMALALESSLPVELWIQPSLKRALQALTRADVCWLHIDTHGADDGRLLMLGATRDGGESVSIDAFPPTLPIPFLMLVGCSVVSGMHSAAATLFRRGVQAVLGPCVHFVSVGITGTPEKEAEWYAAFYNALCAGEDVGTSLLQARRTTPGTLLKCLWLLVGNPFLRFAAGSDGVSNEG